MMGQDDVCQRQRSKKASFLSHSLAIWLAVLSLQGCDARSSALAKLEGKFTANNFCWSRDGKRIAAIAEYQDNSTVQKPGATRHFNLCVWDAHSSKVIWSKALPILNKPHKNNWGDVQFSYDGNFILTTYVHCLADGADEEKVAWWRSATGELHYEITVGGPFDGKLIPMGGGNTGFNVVGPESSNFIPSKTSETVLLVDSHAKSCMLVDVESGQSLSTPLSLKDTYLLCGNTTCFELSDGKLMLFHNQTGELEYTFDTMTTELTRHPSQRVINWSGSVPNVVVKDSNGQITHTISGSDLISDSESGLRLTIDNVSGGKVSVRMQTRFNEFQAVVLSPDTKYLAMFYTSANYYIGDDGTHYQLMGSDGINRSLWAIWSIDGAREIISGRDGKYGKFSPTDRVFLLGNTVGGGFKKIAY